MVLFLSLLAVLPFVYGGGAFLRKHRAGAYSLCVLLAVLTVALSYLWDAERGAVLDTLRSLLTKGGLAGGLFLAVMLAGALPDRSPWRKRLLPIRGELSIMAAILAAGHMATYGPRYFTRLFTSASELRFSALLGSCCSLLLLLVLLPLFVTSFRAVRRNMKPKRWKRLQQTAYLFYLLLYLHILLFQLQGVRAGHWDAIVNVCLYSTVFFSYFSLRLSRAAVKAGKEAGLPWIQLASTALLVLTLTLCFRPFSVVAQTESPETRLPKSWEDGVYKGSALGYNGKLKVSAEIENGRIKNVTLKSHVEDEPYVTRATKGVFAAMIEQNTPDVDAVSTATSTSEALVEAVHQALDPVEKEADG